MSAAPLDANPANPGNPVAADVTAAVVPDATAAVVLDAHQLPAFCPNQTMALWNQHPKVFLDVATTGAASCPYCGTQYRLRGGPAKHGH